MGEERCETCKFWLELDGDSDDEPKAGVCRRYPPDMTNLSHHLTCVALDLIDTIRGRDLKTPPRVENIEHTTTHAMCSITRWPATGYDDWCGEWRPKPGDAEGGGG